MSVIEIDHLAKRFGDVRAVDDLSFAIEAEDLELGLQLQHVAGIVISVVVFTLLGPRCRGDHSKPTRCRRSGRRPVRRRAPALRGDR
jgi:hypothetical protein